MEKSNSAVKTIAYMAIYCAVFVVFDRVSDMLNLFKMASGGKLNFGPIALLEEGRNGRRCFRLSAAGHRVGILVWHRQLLAGLSDRLCRLWHCLNVPEFRLFLFRHFSDQRYPPAVIHLGRNHSLGNAVLGFVIL